MIKSFYFQHDYNAASDSKILFLRHQLGMEGYGVYWFIIEQLAQADGILPLRIIPVLAMQTQVPEAKVKAVVEGYELFEITEDNFFSSRLNKHLNIRKILSEKGKEGAEKRWLPNSQPNSLPISDPNAKERKGKEIKESKVNNTDLVFTFNSLNFLSVWDILKNQPKWKKKSIDALQLSLKKLSKYDEETAIQMMENSIAGGWQGLFEIKNNNDGKRDSETNKGVGRTIEFDRP